MNIFYYSVHHILEDDEIRLLQALGHNVFCFGINRKQGALQGFRPSIPFNPTEHQIFDSYDELGGTFNMADADDLVLPPDFEGHFSAFIIMHDASFIARFWHRLRSKFVIWRTIGQGVDVYEDFVRPLRKDGLKIIRYSPVESDILNSCGEDAIIRFYKRPDQYCHWAGTDPTILTFSNDFEQRYPFEANAYKEIASKVSCALGGGNNDQFVEAFGFLSFEQQLLRYQQHRAYLYISGMEIPYTLNFIEAWMTGIPIVVYAPYDRRGAFFEIDKLILDGVTGFICRDIESVEKCCLNLIADERTARKVGAAGREEAIRLFGYERISLQWQEFLDRRE